MLGSMNIMFMCDSKSNNNNKINTSFKYVLSNIVDALVTRFDVNMMINLLYVTAYALY